MENQTRFNLNTAIESWRRELAAVPGLTAEVRHELETHLHDAISEHQKDGWTDEESFQHARQRIGQPEQLAGEFKKVDNDHKIMRAVLLIIGWLAAGCMLLISVGGWDFDWNFFWFSPKWNLALIWEMLGILVALTAICCLAKASRDKANGAVSLLVCVLLAGFAVWGLRHDENPAAYIWGTHGEIPLWYRGGRTLLLCLPGIFWVWWTRRHLALQRGPTNGNQSVC